VPKLSATGLPLGSKLRAIDSLQGEWIFSWKPSYTQGNGAPYEIAFVSYDDSLKTTRTAKITVKNVNRLPIASAGKDTSLTINDIISLKGVASDPDGPISKMEWDIGGNGNFARVSKPDTNIKAPASALAAFICVFKVTDSDGATAMDSVSFKVTADTPVVKVGADTTVDPGKEFHLKGTATDDGKIIEKSWSCNGSAVLSPSIDGSETVLKISEKDDSTYNCIYKVVDDDGMFSADTIKVKAKLNWTMATDSAAFRVRDGAATVVFKDRMWVIGGSSYDGERFSDIWSSADGKSWRLETDVAECLPRYGHKVLEFGGKLWLIGGSAPIGGSIFKSQSDVWSSFDGVSWTRVKDSAGFTPRQNHSAIVFDNKMWIMGGQDTRKAAITLGDSWYSVDGTNWVLGNATAFPPRVYHKSAVLNGKIWVVGGFQKSDILSSQDGATWKNEEIQKPFYPATHFFQVTIHAGQVWAWEDNQLWLSSDLSTWGESTTSAPFVGRLAPLVYHGKIWCFGGLTKGTKVVHSVWSNTPN
jgi:dihydrofolate reductase